MNFRTLSVAAALAVAGGAQAATVFTDNFDAATQGLNASVSGWTVSDGTVDVVPVGGSFHFLPAANGNYIDLDGSTGAAGTLSRTLTGLAVGAYALTFELAGNFRNGASEATSVTFGGQAMVFTPSSQTSTDYFTITGYSSDGTLTLSFKDNSHDNIGSLLDNVSVSSVPEPSMLSLLLGGVAALGFAARRRRT